MNRNNYPISLLYHLFIIIIFNIASLVIVNESIAREVSAPDKDSIKEGKDASFSFIVWGHPRGRGNESPTLNLEEIKNTVSELKPDFIVITGDMIGGRIGSPQNEKTANLLRKDWDRFDAEIKQLEVPIYRLPGNHDVNNLLSRDIYYERYKKLPYTFTYKNSKFIMMDSNGIDQREDDKRSYWGHAGLPFSKQQEEFLRQNVTNNEAHRNIFVFMHHTFYWAYKNTSWWEKIHPILRGGKTRAVFTGDNPKDMKYSHEIHDGIHYVENNTFPVKSSKGVIKYPRESISTYKQFDNVMHVRVSGKSVKYKVIVLGALTSEAHTWHYWETLNAELPWTRKISDLIHDKFFTFREIVFAMGIWSLLCLSAGALAMLIWKRRACK